MMGEVPSSSGASRLEEILNEVKVVANHDLAQPEGSPKAQSAYPISIDYERPYLRVADRFLIMLRPFLKDIVGGCSGSS